MPYLLNELLVEDLSSYYHQKVQIKQCIGDDMGEKKQLRVMQRYGLNSTQRPSSKTQTFACPVHLNLGS